MPAHAVPVLQRDGSIVRGACWCEPETVFFHAMSDLGEPYVYPHTFHSYPLTRAYFCSLSTEHPSQVGPPC